MELQEKKLERSCLSVLVAWLLVCSLPGSVCAQSRVEQDSQVAVCDSLMKKARLDFKGGEYEESSRTYYELIAILQKCGGEALIPTLKEQVVVNNMYIAKTLMKSKEYEHAGLLMEESLHLCKNGSKVYLQLNGLLGACFSTMSVHSRANLDLKEAKRCCVKAEGFYESAANTKELYNSRISRAQILVDEGEYDSAIGLLRNVLEVCPSDDSYLQQRTKALWTLADVECRVEDFKNAILHAEQSYELANGHNRHGVQMASWVLCRIYDSYVPDVEKSKFWHEIYAKSTEQHEGDAYSGYISDAKVYGNAVNAFVLREYEKGISLILQLIEKAETIDGYDKERLSSYYGLCGKLHSRVKKYSDAERFLKLSLRLLMESGANAEKNLSDRWYNLTLNYFYWDNHKSETVQAADQCVATAMAYYGEGHSQTMDAISLRANIHGFYNNSLQACKDKQMLFDMIASNMEKNFAFLTTTERAGYWDKYRMETQDMPGFARKLMIKEGEFIDYVYNQQLLSKGVLLSTESSLQRTVEDDPVLTEMFSKVSSLRKITRDENLSYKETEASGYEADKLEREMIARAKGVGDFLRFMKVRMPDVKKNLKPGEVAIEFVDCPSGKDSIMYSAVMIRPEWPHARFLNLCESREIERYSNNLVELVWKPVLDELGPDVGNIYFAPAGLLYQIPLESHILPDGKPIGEKYHLFRMSSTRWIAENDFDKSGEGAVLYGGLEYDVSVEELAEDMKKYPGLRSAAPSQDSARKRFAVSSLKPLPGTKTEIEKIGEILSNTAQTKMGKEGTEASFKYLSGQHKKLIHVATHGFYNNQNLPGKDELDKSGLYFAGADNVYMGETVRQDVEDGVLTAREVSELNFSGLDLLVLSACETGLGTLEADGVFGLQRGFKKAGANTILMSLWKVDDEATCKLMTEFYKNLISLKMSKYDALEGAKATVRTTPGWEDPKFWAPFILLDALDVPAHNTDVPVGVKTVRRLQSFQLP